MKDMKILHSMVHINFWYSSLYLIKKKQFDESVYWIQPSHFTYFFYEMADVQNYLSIKYKDEYQKSKWTIECRIFISFIWSRSELWNRNNNNVFTKKRKLTWLDFVDYTINYFSTAEFWWHNTESLLSPFRKCCISKICIIVPSNSEYWA